jgi:hypothetical protein
MRFAIIPRLKYEALGPWILPDYRYADKYQLNTVPFRRDAVLCGEDHVFSSNTLILNWLPVQL